MLKEEVEEPGACGCWVLVELARSSPSRLRRIGSIRLVRSVQDPAQGQELLPRHVPLLQRRHEDVHPRRRPSAARLLSFDPGNPSQLSSAMESSFSVAGSSTIVLQIRERKLVSSNGHSWLIFKSDPLSLDNYFLTPKLSDLQNRPL
ncbi:hypothetical protein F2Q70_00035238 [Brassica cretica]|uniref:Uncharacterized protein n=2 Tax=Brassica cretica TaxID=69181 RepID=A0A3N6TB77_BRACR|nr:hypothetical protein F2Q68_00030323 [Brassica cretica]KAF2587333.1 hypothetical protein F2Q70_00035238 [Brassica cretica]KAF3532993.1 hypothetical protein DY000_02038639 [Brassica cretica]